MGNNDSNKTNRTFFIDFLGCERRKLDAERILQYMISNKYEHVKEEKDLSSADVLIFVSCAFNTEFSNLSRERIRRMLESKRSDSKFILAGCLGDIEPQFLEKNHIDDSVGPRNLKRLDEILETKVKIEDIPEQNTSYFDNREYPVPDSEYRSPVLNEYVQSKNAYKVRVCWGCLSNCSYCAVKRATGNLKSKPLEEVEREIKEGVEEGHRKFFFTGEDVGAYGIDIGEDVVSLLDLITSFRDTEIYIQAFNAQWLIRSGDGIARVLRNNLNNYNKLHLIVPIQSGSNRVLREMKRPYERKEILEAIEKIRHENHKIRVGSHFIVGFPGETREDFNETKKLVDALNLDFIMVFTYSDHPSVESFKMPRKAEGETANRRRLELLKLQRKKDEEEYRYQRIEHLDMETIHRLAEEIEGWLTPKEGELLFNLARQTEDGNVVEIGSWKGKSTFYLCCGLIQGKNGKLYSVDRHTGSEEQRKRSNAPIDTLADFTENMRRFNVGHVIMTFVMGSLDASKRIDDEIGLIFVDGSHEYERVKSDFAAWWPKLREGGTIAFHDTVSKPGVSRFVEEVIATRDDIGDPEMVDEMVFFKKTSRRPRNADEDTRRFLVHRKTMSDKIMRLKGQE